MATSQAGMEEGAAALAPLAEREEDRESEMMNEDMKLREETKVVKKEEVLGSDGGREEGGASGVDEQSSLDFSADISTFTGGVAEKFDESGDRDQTVSFIENLGGFTIGEDKTMMMMQSRIDGDSNGYEAWVQKGETNKNAYVEWKSEETPSMIATPHAEHFVSSSSSSEQPSTEIKEDYQSPAYADLSFDHEFQRLIHSISDEVVFKEQHIFRSLSRLSKDFLAAATRYGQLIIVEKYLPVEQKTCKPASWLHGIAGGEKYFAAGIVFRFAVDTHQLYGSDELAGKEANHQLKTLTQIYNANIEGLSFPLLAVIEYRGFKLVASSLLPINRDTLVYGSHDAGITIEDGEKCQRAREIAAQVASKLNLKRHRVQPRKFIGTPEEQKELYLPVDVEIHSVVEEPTGQEGNKINERLYIIDYARFFPPEPPGKLKQLQELQQRSVSMLTSSTTVASASVTGSTSYLSNTMTINFMDEDEIQESLNSPSPHLIRLFRPEFVKSNPTPLSSDAYSQFGVIGAEKHHADIDESYLRLIRQVIPACAHALDKIPQAKYRMRTCGDLITKHLHVHGVNMRYLGLIFEHLSVPFWRNQILLEAIARCCKAYIRSTLRRTARRVRIASSTPFISATTDALNTLFGIAPCISTSSATEPCCSVPCPCQCQCPTTTSTSASDPETRLGRTPSVASIDSSFSSSLGDDGSLSPRSDSGSRLAPRKIAVAMKSKTWDAKIAASTMANRLDLQDQLQSFKQRWWCKLLPVLLCGRFSFPEDTLQIMLGRTPTRMATTVKEETTKRREDFYTIPLCHCCSCSWRRHFSPAQVFDRVQSTCGIILSQSVQGEVESAVSSMRSVTKPQSAAASLARPIPRTASSLSMASATSSTSLSNSPSSLAAKKSSSSSSSSSQSKTSSNNSEAEQGSLIFSYHEPFEENDIVDITGSVSVLPLIDYAEGTCLSIRAKEKKAHGFFAEAKRLAVAAQSTLERGLNKSPSDPRLLCNRGFLEEEIFGNVSGAAESYVLAVRSSNGTHPRSWYYLSLFIRRHGLTLQNTILDCTIMDGLYPLLRRDIDQIRANASGSHISPVEKKKIIVNDLCEMSLLKSLEAGGKMANSLKELGNFMRYSRQNLVRAEEYYKKALVVDPDQLRALENLASLYESQQRYSLALPLWKQVIGLAPDELLLRMQMEICQYLVSTSDEEAKEESVEEIDKRKQESLKAFLQAIDAIVKQVTEGADESSKSSKSPISLLPNRKKHHKGIVLWLTSDGSGDLYLVHKFCRTIQRVVETALHDHPKACNREQISDYIHYFLSLSTNLGQAALESNSAADTFFPATPATKQVTTSLRRLTLHIMHAYAQHLCECPLKQDIAEAENLLMKCVEIEKTVLTQRALDEFRKRFNKGEAGLTPGSPSTTTAAAASSASASTPLKRPFSGSTKNFPSKSIQRDFTHRTGAQKLPPPPATTPSPPPSTIPTTDAAILACLSEPSQKTKQ